MLLTILLTFFASAQLEKEVPKADILVLAGMTEQTLVAEVEKKLEWHLFNDGDGISCGLKEFYISHYTQSTKTSDAFTVYAEVEGPVGYCGGYAQYMCYVSFKNENGKWAAKDTDCDEGNVYEE